MKGNNYTTILSTSILFFSITDPLIGPVRADHVAANKETPEIPG